jgi:RNA polymerase sigma factor (sigma-70 family)
MGYGRLAIPELVRVFRGETVSGLSEWQLLERYLERRDETAFEALLTRHGPMVFGVCRRMLDNQTDAEDAFQATFLVLVRRARQLGPRDAIGPWLYGVACRVALRSRAQAARRRRFQPIAEGMPAVAADGAREDFELGEVLDQELSRLPSKYRSPLVLCYLEGQTHEEAARLLRWPVGTVKGRLARARDLLRRRLARRGLAPTASAFTSYLGRDATAAPHRLLLERTARSSWKVATGQSTAQVVSTSITSLVEGVLTAMMLNKFKGVGLAVLISCLTITGAAVMARQDAKFKAELPKAVVDTASLPKAALKGESEPKAAAPAQAEESNGTSPVFDPRQELIQAARSAYQTIWKAFQSGTVSSPEQVYQASRRWMEARNEDSNSQAEKVSALSAHLDRIRELVRSQGERGVFLSNAADLAQVKAYAAEAQLWLARAKTSQPEKEDGSGNATTQEPRPGRLRRSRPEKEDGSGNGPGKDRRSQVILLKLEEPISMSFANETPLDDVLKYIKQATTTPTFNGIPIYVDPHGLQEAERSLTSTIQIDLEGIPLRRTLQLMLAQLGLVYFVDDGMLVITSPERAAAPLPPSLAAPSPLNDRLAKAERGELRVEEMNELIEVLKNQEQIKKLLAPKRQQMGGFGAEAGPAPSAEAKQRQDQMDLLLKEMRELVELLKAERQVKKAPAAN